MSIKLPTPSEPWHEEILDSKYRFFDLHPVDFSRVKDTKGGVKHKIFVALANGKTVQQAADEVGRSYELVSEYDQEILKTLGLLDRRELVHAAWQLELLRPLEQKEIEDFGKRYNQLNTRQREIFYETVRIVLNGEGNHTGNPVKCIAHRVNLGAETVRSYRQQVYNIMGISNIAECVSVWLQLRKAAEMRRDKAENGAVAQTAQEETATTISGKHTDRFSQPNMDESAGHPGFTARIAGSDCRHWAR